MMPHINIPARKAPAKSNATAGVLTRTAFMWAVGQDPEHGEGRGHPDLH